MTHSSIPYSIPYLSSPQRAFSQKWESVNVNRTGLAASSLAGVTRAPIMNVPSSEMKVPGLPPWALLRLAEEQGVSRSALLVRQKAEGEGRALKT